MVGWAIFKKSVEHVLANWQEALKIGGPVLVLTHLASVLLIFITTGTFQLQGVLGGKGVGAAGIGPTLIMGAFQFVCLFWIAVAWHRYLLLGETSGGVLPKWHGRIIMAYFAQSILIALIALAVMIAIGAVIYLIISVGRFSGIFIFLVTLILVLAVSFIGYRISVVLPAVAIEKPLTIGEAWEATAYYKSAILILTVLTFLVAGLPSYLLGLDKIGVIVSTILTLILNWFSTMLSVSILTTLYGYLFEGRSLD